MKYSRQRLRESNIKWSIKLTNETFAQKIIKLIEIKSLENGSKIIDLKINNKISDFIENQFLEDLKYFKKKNKIKINIANSEELNLTEYLIEFKSKSGKILDKIEKIENLQKIITKENSNSNIQKPFKKRKFKKRKFVKKKIK